MFVLEFVAQFRADLPILFGQSNIFVVIHDAKIALSKFAEFSKEFKKNVI